MILENIEGFAEWSIRPDWAEGRAPGVSAFVRLKDEAEYVIPSLDSIAWCDEIVIALQGAQSDGTDALVDAWAHGRPHVRVFRYPFDSLPNGPGHGDQPRGSVRERAYFYNWTLAQTTRSHALKWDGDMVAVDGLEGLVRLVVEHPVGFRGATMHGVEIADSAQFRMAPTRKTASECRLFLVTPETFYESGPMCEILRGVSARPLDWPDLEDPAFLHFKWAKARASAVKAWPDEYERIPHFQRLLDRARPCDAYEGPIPSALQ